MSSREIGQRHGEIFHFRNTRMDFYIKWMVGYQTYGGSELGECLHASGHIRDGDPASWRRAFLQLAGRIEALASAARASGHRVSAREAYMRAFTYYRAAALGTDAHGPDLYATYQKARSCFRRASELFIVPIETLQIPFEGKALPGYFMRAGGASGERPTLIVVGGGETYVEDLYFLAGLAGVRRGYNALLVDLPGQGSAPFEGMFFRADYEAPVKAVVDYALGRPDVDGARLAIYGVSSGGYAAMRALAQEKRIRACVVDPPIIDFHRLALDETPEVLLRAPRFVGRALVRIAESVDPLAAMIFDRILWMAGARDIETLLSVIRGSEVDVEKISCPVLCLAGAGDSEGFLSQTYRCYDALTVPKKLRIFSVEEGAEAHVQVNNLSLAHQVAFDWLDDVLTPRASAPA